MVNLAEASTAANSALAVWRRGLNNLAFTNLRTFQQFLMLFLHQGRALRLAGSTLVVQFLTQLESDDQTTLLAHLNLAFDL